MKSGCLLARLVGLPGIRFCPLYSSIPGRAQPRQGLHPAPQPSPRGEWPQPVALHSLSPVPPSVWTPCAAGAFPLSPVAERLAQSPYKGVEFASLTLGGLPEGGEGGRDSPE